MQRRQTTRGSLSTATSAGERSSPGPSSQKPPSATRHESDQVPESARAIVLIVINQRHAAVPPRGRYRTQRSEPGGIRRKFQQRAQDARAKPRGGSYRLQTGAPTHSQPRARTKAAKASKTKRQVTHALAKLQSPRTAKLRRALTNPAHRRHDAPRSSSLTPPTAPPGRAKLTATATRASQNPAPAAYTPRGHPLTQTPRRRREGRFEIPTARATAQRGKQPEGGSEKKEPQRAPHHQAHKNQKAAGGQSAGRGQEGSPIAPLTPLQQPRIPTPSTGPGTRFISITATAPQGARHLATCSKP